MVERLNTKEAIEKRRITRTLKLDEFLKRASKNHNDLDNYDWDKVDLTKKDEKGRVTLYCKTHGAFQIRITHFINGVGCQFCSGRKKDYEKLKKQLSEIHPTLDFSNAKFGDITTNYDVEYVCPKHGVKHSKLYNLLNGEGCKECGFENISIKKSIKNDEFIKRAKIIYGDKYTYDKVDMLNRDENGKIIVTCKEHGDFKVTPANFLLHNSGCPNCIQWSLETEIEKLLKDNGIYFEKQKTFEWLKSTNKLKLDFYLKDYNVAIECQGNQHYRLVEHFGGEEGFEKRIKLDSIKLELCKQHDIPILYYTKYNKKLPNNTYRTTEEILEKIICKKI